MSRVPWFDDKFRLKSKWRICGRLRPVLALQLKGSQMLLNASRITKLPEGHFQGITTRLKTSHVFHCLKKYSEQMLVLLGMKVHQLRKFKSIGTAWFRA